MAHVASMFHVEQAASAGDVLVRTNRQANRDPPVDRRDPTVDADAWDDDVRASRRNVPSRAV